MKSSNGSMAGGLFVLATIFAMMAIPMAIGFFVLPHGTPVASLHADAAN